MNPDNGMVPESSRSILACVLTCCLVSSPLAADVPLDFQEELAFKQAVAKVAPSVIRIETVGGLDRIGEQVLGNGPTTGLVVGADGWILTSSFNFIGKPTGIVVSLPSGEKAPATVIATDFSCHLTLLKVEATGLPVPTASDPKNRRIGQWAIAVGKSYPNGQPGISVGILSAVDRIHGKALQTDAKISPINYGGPLIDLQGNVLGLLAPLSTDGKDDLAGIEWYDSGIGFAIPLERIQRILPKLQSGENLMQGLAGFSIRNPQADGTTVDRVRVGSPAFQGGLRAEDVILQIDEKNVRRESEVRQVLGTKYSGESVVLRYRRGDQTGDAMLTLVGELAPYEMPTLGILLKKSDREGAGVEVRGVVPGSAAADAGILPGDLIVACNDSPLSGRSELRRGLYSMVPGTEAVLTVNRENETRSAPVKLGSAVEHAPARGPEWRRVSTPPKIIREIIRNEDFNREHWILRPGDVPPDQIQSLVVWIHPPGKPEGAEVQRVWESACDARGIALLGPILRESRRWDAEDTEYLSTLIETYRKQFQLSRERVVLYGGPETGGFSLFVALKSITAAGGVILSEAGGDIPLPDLEPENALRVLLLRSSPKSDAVEGIPERLRKMKYPLYVIDHQGGEALPERDELERLIDWVDSTDRL